MLVVVVIVELGSEPLPGQRPVPRPRSRLLALDNETGRAVDQLNAVGRLVDLLAAPPCVVGCGRDKKDGEAATDQQPSDQPARSNRATARAST